MNGNVVLGRPKENPRNSLRRRLFRDNKTPEPGNNCRRWRILRKKGQHVVKSVQPIAGQHQNSATATSESSGTEQPKLAGEG